MCITVLFSTIIYFNTNFHELIKNFRPIRMKIPLVLIRSKYQRKLPLARELFFSRFARNRTNLFKSFKSFSYLFDLYRFVRFDFVDRWFCPLGHSFFSHHIATYREHHFQSYLENFRNEIFRNDN